MNKLPNPKGFTLLEVLMALFIVAITFVAMFAGISQIIHNQERMQTLTYAEWVATNVMALQASGLNAFEPFHENSGTMTMGHTQYAWEVTREATQDQDVAKIEVSVFEGQNKILSLTGYRKVP